MLFRSVYYFGLYNWGNILYIKLCLKQIMLFYTCKTVIGGYSCGPKKATPYCVGLVEIKILAMPWAQKLFEMSWHRLFGS